MKRRCGGLDNVNPLREKEGACRGRGGKTRKEDQKKDVRLRGIDRLCGETAAENGFSSPSRGLETPSRQGSGKDSAKGRASRQNPLSQRSVFSSRGGARRKGENERGADSRSNRISSTRVLNQKKEGKRARARAAAARKSSA